MNPYGYPVPHGVHMVSPEFLDLRPDADIDEALSHPEPVKDDKNVWFFWHSGYDKMHPYTQRNVRAWYRRFSKAGWAIRVLNKVPGSLLDVAKFLDVSDPLTFPRAFTEGSIGGDHAPQHTSDLIRFPLLLKYGGVWADVGLMQIGDLDRIWSDTIGNPDSPYEVLSYTSAEPDERDLMNHFLVAQRNNPLFLRCHKLLLALWAEDGGKQSTEGMHRSILLKGLPLMGAGSSMTIEEEGKPSIGPEEVSRILTDYIIQGQAISMVMGLVDQEDEWDGPHYCANHVYVVPYMIGSQLINELTGWDGHRAFNLMSLALPKRGELESTDQELARTIVERCLQESFGFKLAHGLIIKVLGQTLGSLWRSHEGSDDVPGTYAHWLRFGIAHWCQDKYQPALVLEVIEPVKRGPLLRDA